MAQKVNPKSQINAPSGSGYVIIGSIMIAWGSATANSIGTGAYAESNTSVTFPVAFSSAPSVTCSISDINNAVGEYISVGSVSTTGAGFWCGHVAATGASSTPTIRWMAIGAA